jgi:rubrerythrin
LLSRNPTEPSQKIEGSGVAQAVRLAIIAELDAINLYQQLADAVSDESVRKVLLDVAGEEKTHFGEFLELLRRLDPEQVKELEAGSKEVASLVSSQGKGQGGSPGDPQPLGPLSGDEAESLRSAIAEALGRARALRSSLPVAVLGDGSLVAPSEAITEGDVIKASSQPVQLSRLITYFDVEQDLIDYSRRLSVPLRPASAIRAAELLGLEEDALIASSLASSASVKESGSWSSPGSFTSLLAKALEDLKVRYPSYLLIISPSTRARLASVVDPAGVDELSRASRLVDRVVVSPGVGDGVAILVPPYPDVADVVVGSDLRLDYLGPSGSSHRFAVWETVAVRVKSPQAIAVITG